ncbi:MAG: glycosyltransferase [Candidatus Bathyarchaeota archaeon]|nr:glycosyltransferase [Candidatus Bathyarchaeota archaeon]
MKERDRMVKTSEGSLGSLGMFDEWALIVTSDRKCINEVCTVLDAEGCQIDTAKSASSALEKLTRRSYILLLMDVSLPDMSGLEFLALARMLASDSIKIMLFHPVEAELGLDALKMGGVDYILQKPVRPDKLVRVIWERLKERSSTLFSTARKDDVTVVLPVLNEEEAIGLVLKELKTEGYENVLVVDGYSTDKTIEIARESGAKVVLQHGKGKSGGLKTAFKRVETPYLLVMDGDHTYCAQDIERFVPFAREFDQVFGVRMDRDNVGRIHRLGNWIINIVLNVLFGTSVSDVCTGMYMMKTDVAQRMELHSRGFDVEVEMAIQNITNGKVTEVPIHYRERIGERKLSTWKQGFQILWTVFRLSFSYNPILFLSTLGAFFLVPGVFILLREFYMRLIYGDAGWSIGYVWLGLVLFIAGLNSFTLAVFSLISKRQERRIIRHIRDISR